MTFGRSSHMWIRTAEKQKVNIGNVWTIIAYVDANRGEEEENSQQIWTHIQYMNARWTKIFFEKNFWEKPIFGFFLKFFFIFFI